MDLILRRLKDVLKKETEDKGFQYIFLTGDLANCNVYSMVEERIKDLLLDSGILEDGGKIFWVCGNHDIPRTLKHRKSEIQEIRSKKEIDNFFEQEFRDEENRNVILAAFKEYYEKRESLFDMKMAGWYPHQVIHTDKAEIVLLNTCLTSCDDEDEHNLYLVESGLVNLFDQIEPGKPIFAVGHHSLDYLNDTDKKKLISLFKDKKVSVYLCGHSHQLEVKPLADDIQEIVSGGFKLDGYATCAFFIGEFDEEQEEYRLIPYTYRMNSMNWGEDYYAIAGMEKGKRYPMRFAKRRNAEELMDIIIQAQKLFKGISEFDGLAISRFNQVGERILRKYVQTFPDAIEVEKMNFETLCEIAIQKGNDRINCTSLRLTETMRDIWRYRQNLINILHEMGKDNVVFSTIKEILFDFNEFFETVNQFDVTENTYVLVVDAIHDISDDRKKMLTEFQWDIILDYDGYSEKKGLRGCASGQNIKDLAGYQVVRESILRRGITSWIHMGEKMKFSLEYEDSEWNMRKVKVLYEETVRKLFENTNGMVIFVFMKDIEPWDRELMRIAWERFEEKAKFVMIGAYNSYVLSRQMQGLFFDSIGNSVESCYEIFQTSLSQFLRKYCEYSENFLKKRNYEDMRFPSNNGLVKLNQNLYVNLSDFFEVLVSDIGTDQKHRYEDMETFYLGGEAAWSLFYTKDILQVMEQDVLDDLINRMKTALGAKQEQHRNAIFYLLHEAGFGGTTVAKGIAWKMHFEHPTLILKNYVYGKIKPLVQNLYDNHARKGILIIADESRFSITDLENLEKEMGTVDRPFALLVVKRLAGKITGKSKNVKKLITITKEKIDGLRSRFAQHSRLDSQILV